MSVIKGLKAIQNKMDGGPSLSDGPRARWLKLEDGQSVKIRFVNEIDPDSPNYDAGRGLAIVVSEHTNPKDYRRKAICSMSDEGRCYGCERDRQDPKAGWRPRLRYYTNLLVEDGDDQYVAIWSQGVGPKSTTTKTIIEYASDTESVSNLVWKLKRSGTGTSTAYTLFPMLIDTEPFDWSGVQPHELEKVAVRSVPYSDQENFYMGLESDDSTSGSSEW
jgi:hypothetical protein